MDEKEAEDLSVEDNVFIDMCEELDRATEAYPPFHSPHEAMAVIQEEFHEFQLEVYKKQKDHDFVQMRAELIQIGAMCARAIIDLEL